MNIHFSYLTPQRGAGMTSSEPVAMVRPVTMVSPRHSRSPFVIPAKAGIWRDGGDAYSLAIRANESNGTRARRNLTRFPPSRE